MSLSSPWHSQQFIGVDDEHGNATMLTIGTWRLPGRLLPAVQVGRNGPLVLMSPDTAIRVVNAMVWAIETAEGKET